MPAHVPRFLAAAVLALAACATARAQSFISFTTPDPVSAGHPFNLTVAGMLYATGAQPVPTVRVEGPVVTVILGRVCGLPACPQSGFRTQVVPMPGLFAGTYAARIYQGTSSASPDPHIQAIFTVAGPNYQGLWWNAPAGSQPGWGLAIDHQGDTLFAAWFTYGSTGAGQWLVMPNAARASDSTYSGDIYRTTGPAFNSRPWDPSAVASTKVGSGTLTFSSDRNGTFAYTVDGQSGGNTITRELFSSPVASCTAVP